MPRMFRAIWGDLFPQPASRCYLFKDIKESLADYRCRAYPDSIIDAIYVMDGSAYVLLRLQRSVWGIDR